MIRRDSGFHFGLEAEFLLVEARSFHPLWHLQLSFDELNALLESIAIDDFDCEGLDLTPLHRKKMPFVIVAPIGKMRKRMLERGMMGRNAEVRTLIGHRHIALLLKPHSTHSPRRTSGAACAPALQPAYLSFGSSSLPFRKSTCIDTTFAPHRVKEFFRQRATVRSRIASHHDNNDFAHTCHDHEKIVSCPANSQIVLLDVLQIVPTRLVSRKAQADSFIWCLGRTLKIKQGRCGC